MVSIPKLLRLMPVVFAIGVALAGLLVGSMFVVTPDKLGPFGITLWFLAALASLWSIVAGVVYFFLWWLNRPQARKTSLQAGGLVSGYVIALLALNSLRQLDLKDIVLVSLLVLLAGFYLRKV